jgi:hypothetical protein
MLVLVWNKGIGVRGRGGLWIGINTFCDFIPSIKLNTISIHDGWVKCTLHVVNPPWYEV